MKLSRISSVAMYGSVALLVLACAATVLPVPTDAQASKLRESGMQVTAEDLAIGKQTLETTCTKCHGVKGPSDARDSDWPQTLAAMSAKAGIDSVTTWRIKAYMTAVNLPK